MVLQRSSPNQLFLRSHLWRGSALYSRLPITVALRRSRVLITRMIDFCMPAGSITHAWTLLRDVQESARMYGRFTFVTKHPN